MDWADEELAARMPLALVDDRKGGALVAGHLAAAGHRRVLLAGPPNMLRDPWRHGAAFRAARAAGGIVEVVITYAAEESPSLDAKAAAAILRGADAPTAVFGLRDYDVVSLQRALAGEGLDLHALCEVIGYGNTPWSRGPLEFSTVDWNLEAIAEATCGFIVQAAQPGEPPPHIAIAPRLVLRGTVT
jgi:DNA-binding LacI/PurR family transcriptional regulator